jgi:hypothetical protein
MGNMNKIGSTATVVGCFDSLIERFYFCQYHATKVVQWDDRKIILNSNGWQTYTTKARMNQTSNQFMLGFSIYQENFKWYVLHKGKTVPYYDGMELIR